MKILLCLLSDQHVPNLLSVHHFRPDRLVLVESAEMRRKQASNNFLSALKLGGHDFGDNCHVQQLERENDLGAIRNALQRAYARCAGQDWIANLTGGTKPMSIAAYEFFNAVGARLIYVNAPAPNVFLGLDGQAAETCGYRPSIKEFLARYGFESRKADEAIRQAENRARMSWDCARLIAASDPTPALLHFGGLPADQQRKEWNRARDRGLDLQPAQFGPVEEEVRAAVRACFELQYAGDSLRGRLDKYAVEYLTGGWLEVFLWGLLERHGAALGIWDVRPGICPGKIEVPTCNELDIAFMREYGLATVECKSGAQGHDPDADVLHKVEAVMRQFRALLVRSYLATTSANVLDSGGALRPAIRDRAELYKCRVVIPDQIRQLAHDPDPDLTRRLFFDDRQPN
jgi:hypothetical protein